MKFDFISADIAESLDPERLMKDFETSKKARFSRDELIDNLRAAGLTGHALRRILEKCSLERPCRSAACPVCMRQFRRWWCSWVADWIVNEDYSFNTVSIVSPRHAYPKGELYKFDGKAAKDALRKQLDRGNLKRKTIIGGFDYLLQTFKHGQPKWRPHFYLIMQGKNRPAIKRALDESYSADVDTRKPLVINELKRSDLDAVTVATYSYKSLIQKSAPTKDKRGNKDTFKYKLDPDERAELAVFLHEQGYLGRIYRQGCNGTFRYLRTR